MNQNQIRYSKCVDVKNTMTMLSDLNKGITEILYNHLNLPTLISFANGNSIEYLYNAAGIKVEKKVHDTQNNTIKQVEYLDGFQYAGGMLQFFPHAEGYIAATPGGIGPGGYTYIFNYVYNYTDHLGNIRLSYTKDPVSGDLEIMEENHYYPFGLKHSVYADPKQMYLLDEEEELARPAYVYETEYQYKFQGQELQDELGLNWYSFKWRNYMPDIGRFFNVDPLSESYCHQSHYNFAENMVIVGRELEGLEVVMPPWVVGVGRPSISIGRPVSIPQGLNPPIILNPPYVEARGPVKRTAAPDAEGDHTVVDDRGSTTYQENPNNPNKNEKGKGFETVKRVDRKGGQHKNSNGEDVPTPHVHENGNVRPAIPGEDMPKGVLPAAEKTDGAIDAQKQKQKENGNLPDGTLDDALKRQNQGKQQQQKQSEEILKMLGITIT